MIAGSVLLALAAIAGAPWAGVIAAAIALWSPELGAVIVVLLIAAGIRRQRGGDEGVEAAFFRSISAELRAGASLRTAISSAAGSAPGLNLESAARLASSGATMSRVAADIESNIKAYGREASSSIEIAGSTGGSVAAVFDGLALVAAGDDEVSRERRAATAQARASAWVIGAIPVLALVLRLSRGSSGLTGLEGLFQWIGMALVALGLGLVVLISSRASRARMS